MRRRDILLGASALGFAGAVGWRGTIGSMAAYRRAESELRAAPMPHAGMVDLLRIASLAPSGHNAQPWRFRLGPDYVEVLADPARRTPAVDPDDHHLHVSLGAAAETLAVAGPAFGRPGAVAALPDGSLRFDFAAGAIRTPSVLVSILRRQSVRAEYEGVLPSSFDLDALAAAAKLPGVRLALISDRPRLDRLTELAAEGNRAQFGDPAFVAELLSWMRFSPRQALASCDGLFAPTAGAPTAPPAIGRMFFSGFATAAAENARLVRWMASTPVVAAFFADQATPECWAQVGRALVRFLLAATERGMVAAFINQPVEVPALRPELAALAGEPGLRPDLVLRLGYGPRMPFSLRRPVERLLA